MRCSVHKYSDGDHFRAFEFGVLLLLGIYTPGTSDFQ